MKTFVFVSLLVVSSFIVGFSETYDDSPLKWETIETISGIGESLCFDSVPVCISNSQVGVSYSLQVR